jgi:hypothetical protein
MLNRVNMSARDIPTCHNYSVQLQLRLQRLTKNYDAMISLVVFLSHHSGRIPLGTHCQPVYQPPQPVPRLGAKYPPFGKGVLSPSHDDFDLWGPSEEREEICLFGEKVCIIHIECKGPQH